MVKVFKTILKKALLGMEILWMKICRLSIYHVHSTSVGRYYPIVINRPNLIMTLQSIGQECKDVTEDGQIANRVYKRQ